jgi:hypothetical protein
MNKYTQGILLTGTQVRNPELETRNSELFTINYKN